MKYTLIFALAMLLFTACDKEEPIQDGESAPAPKETDRSCNYPDLEILPQYKMEGPGYEYWDGYNFGPWRSSTSTWGPIGETFCNTQNTYTDAQGIEWWIIRVHDYNAWTYNNPIRLKYHYASVVYPDYDYTELVVGNYTWVNTLISFGLTCQYQEKLRKT